MAQYYTLPTAIGEAKIANAIALGSTITISELAIGDGGGTTPTPDSDRTSLVNQVRRAPINTSEPDPDNPNWIVVEQVLPPDIGGWTIREVGLFDADGDMIAYGNYPETYKPQLSEGSGRTQTIRFVMQVSDTAAVTLKVDPSVVLATRKYVDDSGDAIAGAASDALTAHAESRNHPAATTTGLGFVEKATATEAKSGATDKFPDSAGVKAALDDRIADQSAVDAGEDNTKFVTSLTLGKRLKNAAVWTTMPVGMPFPLYDFIPGIELPPNDDPNFRYVKLSAGASGDGQYNYGVLEAESVSGSAPLITANALVNLPGSPFDGRRIKLINTDKRFIGAGEGGILEDDSIQNITGSVGGSNYWPTGVATGAFINGSHKSFGQSEHTATQRSGFSFNASRVARTSDHTQPRAIRVPHYVRIL